MPEDPHQPADFDDILGNEPGDDFDPYDLAPAQRSCRHCGRFLDDGDSDPCADCQGRPPPGFIADAISCATCGYNLQGLTAGSPCPECGAVISTSIHSDRLEFSGPQYLQRLRSGMSLICYTSLAMVVALGGFIVFLLLSFVSPMGGGALAGSVGSWLLIALAVVAGITTIVSPILLLIGWWRVTAPDPRFTLARDARSRSAVRVSLVALVASVVLSWLMQGIQSLVIGASGSVRSLVYALDSLSSLVFFGGLLALHISTCLYIATLSRRVPDHSAAERASRYTWMLPVVLVGGFFVSTCCAGAIGPFGMGVGLFLGLLLFPFLTAALYVTMLFALRTRLNEIRVRQAASNTSQIYG